jgi:hypothetical protein
MPFKIESLEVAIVYAVFARRIFPPDFLFQVELLEIALFGQKRRNVEPVFDLQFLRRFAGNNITIQNFTAKNIIRYVLCGKNYFFSDNRKGDYVLST